MPDSADGRDSRAGSAESEISAGWIDTITRQQVAGAGAGAAADTPGNVLLPKLYRTEATIRLSNPSHNVTSL